MNALFGVGVWTGIGVFFGFVLGLFRGQATGDDEPIDFTDLQEEVSA